VSEPEQGGQLVVLTLVIMVAISAAVGTVFLLSFLAMQ